MANLRYAILAAALMAGCRPAPTTSRVDEPHPGVPLPPGDLRTQARGVLSYLVKSPWADPTVLARVARLQLDLQERDAARATLRMLRLALPPTDRAGVEQWRALSRHASAPRTRRPVPPARAVTPARREDLEARVRAADSPVRKATALARLAVALRQTGDSQAFSQRLAEAAGMARALRGKPDFDRAIGQIAIAQATVGDLTGATATARQIVSDAVWVETLLDSVRFARAGALR